MSWSDAIEQAIIELGYIATLKEIYPLAIQIYSTQNIIKGKTPENTIQERVQRDNRFFRVRSGLYAIKRYLYKIPVQYVDYIPVQKINSLELNNIKPTEISARIKARIGQHYFRTELLKILTFCPITGINDSRLLLASHIKPWRVSNDQERLDTNNGFIFSPAIDKLFDLGLISFTDNKKIIISKTLDKHNLENLNISNNNYYPNLCIEGREKYLEYHRDMIFID